MTICSSSVCQHRIDVLKPKEKYSKLEKLYGPLCDHCLELEINPDVVSVRCSNCGRLTMLMENIKYPGGAEFTKTEYYSHTCYWCDANADILQLSEEPFINQ